jgi:hypothetical protein
LTTVDPVAAVQQYLQTENRMFEDTDMHNKFLTRIDEIYNLDCAMQYIEDFTMSAMRSLKLKKRDIAKVYRVLLSTAPYGKSLSGLDMPPQNVMVQGNVRGYLNDAVTNQRVFMNEVTISMSQSLFVPTPMPTHMAGNKILELAAVQLVGMFDYDWL